jgi:hypothetical protein
MRSNALPLHMARSACLLAQVAIGSVAMMRSIADLRFAKQTPQVNVFALTFNIGFVLRPNLRLNFPKGAACARDEDESRAAKN